MAERGHLERDVTPIAPSAGPPRQPRGALPLEVAGAGMLVRAVSVRPRDVVFVKGLVEACDGLASVFAERGGELLLAAPHGREEELSELLADLEAEIGARVGRDGPWESHRDTRPALSAETLQDMCSRSTPAAETRCSEP